jgi:hypothetical protein
LFLPRGDGHRRRALGAGSLRPRPSRCATFVALALEGTDLVAAVASAIPAVRAAVRAAIAAVLAALLAAASIREAIGAFARAIVVAMVVAIGAAVRAALIAVLGTALIGALAPRLVGPFAPRLVRARVSLAIGFLTVPVATSIVLSPRSPMARLAAAVARVVVAEARPTLVVRFLAEPAGGRCPLRIGAAVVVARFANRRIALDGAAIAIAAPASPAAAPASRTIVVAERLALAARFALRVAPRAVVVRRTVLALAGGPTALAERAIFAVLVARMQADEPRRNRFREEQRLTVVEVDAVLPSLRRSHDEHGVFASRAAAALTRIVDRAGKVQEAPSATGQPVLQRALGVACTEPDVKELGRLRRVAGFDRDRVPVERSNLVAHDLVARPVASSDRALDVLALDGFAKALVQGADDLVDVAVAVGVELEVELVGLVAQHVRQGTGDSLDQRGVGHAVEQPAVISMRTPGELRGRKR